MNRWKSPQKYDLFFVAGIALLVRLIYVWQLSYTPFFASPVVDAEYHDALAREILRQGFTQEGVYFRAPLYPYFLAVIYLFSDGSFWAARLVQALLGTLTAVLTYALGWEITRRRSIALFAGLGAALYGMLVYYDGELLVETLFIPLLLAACLAYAKVRTRGKIREFLVVGLLLGLAAITRPSALVLLPVLLLDQLFLRKVNMRSLFYVFALTTGCLAPILPVTWHNYREGGGFILIASSGGLNFYIGNNEYADGMHSSLPGMGAIWDMPYASYRAYQAEGRFLTPAEIGQYYSGLGWKFIYKHPREAAKLTLKKFCVFWNKLEVSNNRDLYFFKDETGILPYLRIVGFWLVGPLSLLGMIIGWHRKIIPGWLLGLILVYMASVVIFFVTARFRAPLVPFLLICAAVTIVSLLERHKPYFDWTSKIALIAALLILGLFVNLNPWGLRAENRAHAYFSLGGAYMKSGKLEAAKQAFEHTLEADSLYPRAHLNLGVLAYMQKRPALAEQQYLNELKLHGNDARAFNNLGVLRFEAEDYDKAAAYYEKAMELEPYYKDALINLAQAYFKLGMKSAQDNKTLQAAVYFQQAIELDSEKGLYHYNYALALGLMGYAAQAREHLEIAVKQMPTFAPAKELLRRLQGNPSAVPQTPP